MSIPPLPYTPYSEDCLYKATVDPVDKRIVQIHLSGLTEHGLEEVKAIEKAELIFQNKGGGYTVNAGKYGSDSPDSYHWTFPPGGEESHFTLSDGAGNPFRIDFVKTESRNFKFECKFVARFREEKGYDPSRTYTFIDYVMKEGDGRMRDTFKSAES